MFHFIDEDYRLACWLKKDIRNKFSQSGAISGPRACNPSSECCESLKFVSSGSLATSNQNHVIGDYEKVVSEKGYWKYIQLDNFHSKVYYYDPLKVKDVRSLSWQSATLLPRSFLKIGTTCSTWGVG